MGLVCQSDAIPNAGSRFDRFDFDDDDDVLLPLRDCNFGHGLNDEIRLLGTESRMQESGNHHGEVPHFSPTPEEFLPQRFVLFQS